MAELTFQQECLRVHNDYRKKHQAPDLVLNPKISAFSQEWANNLAARDTMQHSQGSGYGENLYMKWSSGTTTVTGQEAVDSWYNEIKDYNFAYGGFSGKTGHFTQVVWKSSKELGVGKATSRTGRIYVVCNYSPPGNYTNAGMFAANVLPSKP